MNPFRSNVGTLNEILFENKNKSYGAYAIRKGYESTVLKSLGITATIMLGGMWILASLLGKEAGVVIPQTDDVKTKITIIELNDLKKLEKPAVEQPKSAAAAVKNNALTQVVIKNNPVDSAKLAVNDPINPVGTGTTAIGTGTTTTSNTLTTTNTLTIGGGSTEPVIIPDEWPSFPGLKKFWADNLKYPGDARAMGVEGKVAINFILDEEGKIMSCKIIKKLGYGCDEEVLRVAKLMPNWKPGKVGGKPVKVSFSQVVDFKLR